MPLSQYNTYTIEDIYVLPEGERAELIDGQIYYMAPPSSKQMDYFTKLFKYRTSGVREYWIVDPTKNFIIVYNFDNNTSDQYTFADTIKAGIYNDLYIDFSGLNL